MKLSFQTIKARPNPMLFWGLVAGLFFYLFPVILVPSGVPLALISYVILAALWVSRPITIPLDATPFVVSSVLIVLSIYAAFVTILTGADDLTFAVQMAKVSTLYVGSGVMIGVICIGMRSLSTFDTIIRAFAMCCFIQSMFIGFSIVSIEFRIVLDNLIVATGNTNYLESFRVRGFSSAGGAALALNQAIGVLSCLYLLLKTQKSVYIYMALAIWIPTFFVGRTGFYLGGMLLALYFLSFSRAISFLRSILFKPLGIVGASFVLVLILVAVPNINIFFEDEALDRLEYAIQWGFELFLNAGSGRAETSSTNAIIDMLIVPIEPQYLLFGFGVFDSGAFGYERTDSGYLKTLYSSGMVGVIALYGTLYSALLLTAHRYRQRLFSLYIGLIVAIIAITEVKEPFLYQNYVGRYVFIIIGAGAVINWSEMRRRAIHGL